MIRLRALDGPGIRSYVDELRPRFLLLRIRTKDLHLRWAVPTWAIEEVVRFALRVAPLAVYVAPHLPPRMAARLRRFGPAADGRRILALLGGRFSERHRDLLALPAGEPLVSVEAQDVTLEVKPIVLGARP